MTGSRRKRPGVPTALAVALGSMLAHDLGGQELTYQGAVSYSRGSYAFTEPTSSWWLSTGFRVRSGRLALSGSLPLIVQNSGLVSVVAGGALPTGGMSSGAVAHRSGRDPIGSGRGGGGGMGMGTSADSLTVVFRDTYEAQVGDPYLHASVELFAGTGVLRAVALDASVKVPARSVESGVGTGAWDAGVGASLALGHGATLLLADASYWRMGDLPDLELRDGLMYALSVSRALGDGKAAVSATLSGASTVVETLDAPLSAGLALVLLPRSGRSFSFGVAAGIGESAPDFSTYVGWSLRLAG